MVPERGLEPPRGLPAHGPEPCVSANFTTPAWVFQNDDHTEEM